MEQEEYTAQSKDPAYKSLYFLGLLLFIVVVACVSLGAFVALVLA